MKHPLPPHFTDRLLKIALIGCGGNGSQMLSGLARMHFALRAFGHHGVHVTAFDPDFVSDANVGRQLFSPSDLGQNKACVLINRLNNYYGLNWSADPDRFDRTDGYDFSLLVGCVDSAKSRIEIARSRCQYWLDLGNTDRKGQVILGELQEPERPRRTTAKEIKKGMEPGVVLETIRQRLPHLLDLFPELKRKRFKEDDAPSCSLAEALERQDLFINQSVATFALQLLWQFIRQGGLDIHGYFINLETGRVIPLPIK